MDGHFFRGSVRVRRLCVVHVPGQLVRVLRMLPRQHFGLQVLRVRQRPEEHQEENGGGASRELGLFPGDVWVLPSFGIRELGSFRSTAPGA